MLQVLAVSREAEDLPALVGADVVAPPGSIPPGSESPADAGGSASFDP
jgi:hypothetical protein